jgi:ABC-type branched-subunit amino acid transport system substrate-binding protein
MQRTVRSVTTRRTLSVTLVGAVLSALLLAACGASSSSGGSSGNSYKIAFVTELTGPFSVSRKPFDEGVVAYFKSNPTVNGKKVSVHLYDDQSNPASAPTVFRQAVSSNPTAIIDFALSTSTAAAEPILSGSGVPCLCIGADDTWYTPKPHPWVFEANPTTLADAQAYVLAAQKLIGGSLQGKSIAISGDDTAYETIIRKLITSFAPKYGFHIVSTQIGPTTAPSWSSEAAKIVAAKPDAIINLTSVTGQIVQLKALEAAGLTKVPIVAFPGLAYTDLTSLKLSNVYVMTPWPYGTPPSSPVYKAAAKYGYLADEKSYEFAFGWAQAAVVRQALSTCGSSCSGSDLEKAFAGIHNFTPPGGVISGPVSFSSTDHASKLPQTMLHWDQPTSSLKIAGTVTPSSS